MSSYRSYSSRRSPVSSGYRRSYHASPGPRRRPGQQYIDPARFVRAAAPAEQAEYAPTHAFADFAVDERIKANLTRRGFETPTPIQDQAIPQALAGKDIIGIANTGTGKTAAFAVPILHRLINDRQSSALIVAPTRELAQQIETECRSLGQGTGLNGAVLIGGAPMGPQLRSLKENPRIIIGTPGRIKDHLERGSLKLFHVNLAVLDEVDRMLDMGFINDVRFILSQLSTARQSFFFSATMEPKVKGLIESFSNEPVFISLKRGDTSEYVNQDVVRYALPSEKLDKLHNILIGDGVNKVLVFDETQRKVEKLSRELADRGFAAVSIHGGKSQGQRQRALKRFRDSEADILVATDVAARGLDITDITHVINYSQPNSYEDYVHRIGRAGRAGRAGHALTFVTG
jgi:superfamily II DNA/RNA helicase